MLFSEKLRFLCLSPTEHDILSIIDDNFLKTQVIRFKLVAFDCIRLILQVNTKNMYLSLKNNILLSKKLEFSCLSPTEHDIFAMIADNSLKTKGVRSS